VTKALSGYIRNFLSSRWFFLLVVLFFTAEVVWTALNSAFPMPFDETYHLGLIQFFSHHLNPFVTSQPSNTYYLGAIAHDPSVLYHYILSFPYRIILLFTHNIDHQVIALRLINIGFSICSLFIMRTVLRALHVPSLLANIVVFLFAFTPILSEVSAQLNYDNLLIPLTGLSLLLTIKLSESIKKGVINIRLLSGLLATCIVASLTQYIFLPIFLAIFIYISVLLLLAYHHQSIRPTKGFIATFRSLSIRSRLVILIPLICISGIFVQYYGYNIVTFHAVSPQCNQVLSTTDCQQYGAWNRNYIYTTNPPPGPHFNIIQFSENWGHSMFRMLFSAVNSLGSTTRPLRFIYLVALILCAVAFVGFLIRLRPIIKKYPTIILFAVILITYLGALWTQNFQDYQTLQTIVGVQGRYLLPVLICVYVPLALGLRSLIESLKPSYGRVIAPLVVVLLLVAFGLNGGYVTYLTRVATVSQEHSPTQ
jgi:hypothetical protein